MPSFIQEHILIWKEPPLTFNGSSGIGYRLLS